MARFYLPSSDWQAQTTLDEEESRHCSQVLRMQRGDTITVFDGQGRHSLSTIIECRKNAVRIELGEIINTPLRTPHITLAQAVPKGKTMDWIVEKAVELGVQKIIPLVTRHTVVKYDTHEAPKKAEKWQKVALEACKQCGQNWMPLIETPQSWQTFTQTPRQGLSIIASLADGATSFKNLLEKHPHIEQATLLVGPEGDFSPTEIQEAISLGFHPITLGDIVLRSETAALLGLAALQYEYSC
jgi:16S rRNA (uracil1498-N3)-methyltransferase